MKIIAIIQARMGSTRLPGKILKKVNGKPLLQYQIERLRDCEELDEVIIATTELSKDNLVADFCKENNIICFRGSEQDVLSRYFLAAKQYKADVVVRITSDCPLIDPEIVDKVIKYYKDNNFDYVSNVLERTFPRGLDTEVFSFTSLEKVYIEAKTADEREHVTLYYYNKENEFTKGNVKNDRDLHNYRLTVDTEEDFTLIEKILSTLFVGNPKFRLMDIITLMEKNPSWYGINAHIEQKKVLGE
ncbi:glycosyltransferase family protein [Solibacillus sp. FSL H8-0523]|uniref:glycosyltransferase family protein n=1 Tax=Solibacillus sp. FSL H8-0523 TaxID=2954511 RepID=UPI00310175B1